MYSKEEIDLLWCSLPSANFDIRGVEQRFYYEGDNSKVYISYDGLNEVVNGKCTDTSPVGKDLVVRLFLEFVPFEKVPLFINTPLGPYANWRLKLGR